MQRILLEVAEAIASGKAVVALESTLISHGLPFPDSLETARAAEAAVRAAGAVPATIAVRKGVVHVGLTDEELVELAVSRAYRKASRRDLAAALAQGADASTTVSATMEMARSVSIGVMATGGLGGVHRGAAISFDISTDLDALANCKGMLVVCSGVKSILDIPATLEALETRGIPVVGYQTDSFPAFTSLSSGLALDTRADSPEEAAAIVLAHRSLKLAGAVVLAQPVPRDVALDRDLMEQALASALARAEAEGVRGKEITPFLLSAIREGTDGKSLAANRALIVANAGLAGEVAVRMAEQQYTWLGRDNRSPVSRTGRLQ